MTVCNMAIEAGARAGMIAPDQTTYDYLADRPMTPKGDHWDRAVAYWQTLPSDAGAVYDVEITLAAEDIAPTVTWGTSPEDALAITDSVPHPDKEKDANKRAKMERAIAYMGLTPGQKLTDIKVDTVFIGSCTNSRIEDLRAAAALAEGRKVADGMRALVVPGSGLVKEQAEAEGLDKVFIDAGFEWREPGCSMCLAMNADKLAEGERCARHQTAISKAVRVVVDARILLARKWLLPRHCRVILPMCGISKENGVIPCRNLTS